MVFFLRRCPLRSHRQSTTADAAPRGAAHHSQASSLARPSDLSGHELPTVWGVYGLARGRSEGCGASASGPRLCAMLRHQRIANLYAWLFCGEPGGRASADAVPEAMPFWRKLRQPCASGGTRPPVFYIPKWLCRRSAACLRGPASAARPGPADVRPPQTLRQVPRLANLRTTRRTRARRWAWRGRRPLHRPPDRLRLEIREGQEGAEISVFCEIFP
jgi:hypothetical protein